MGVFDSIHVRCPACGANIEFQSKSGDCFLQNYSLFSAPADVIVGTSPEQCACGRVWRLVLPSVQPVLQEEI